VGKTWRERGVTLATVVTAFKESEGIVTGLHFLVFGLIVTSCVFWGALITRGRENLPSSVKAGVTFSARSEDPDIVQKSVL
jgi:hypothetical protein